MADNLPLIPEKGSVCADVRPLLRTVFRELDYLPPLAVGNVVELNNSQTSDPSLPLVEKNWEQKYKSECKDISSREEELKHEHAKRISQEPLPNIFKLYPPAEKVEPKWKLEHGLLKRRDLVPNIEQNAGRETSLWIKNTLNASSCDIKLKVQGINIPRVPRSRIIVDHESLLTLSIGLPIATIPKPMPSRKVTPPQPKYAICVPSHLEFVNFTVGRLFTQDLRIINVSKFEIRLSIKLPARPELSVQLAGPRGLRVTAGAEAELRVTFLPVDVRAFSETLVVRVSAGDSLEIPIDCYMKPPILNILIPSIRLSLLSDDDQITSKTDNVLELGTCLLGHVHCSPLVLRCGSTHASFFLLTEDAWLDYDLNCVTDSGSVVAGPFVVTPCWWLGGGVVRGVAWCNAQCVGAHTAALALVSSTATVRTLHLLADVMYYSSKHITIEAQEKDYDILSEDDPDCEYYVHLNSAFPNRELSATVNIVNQSPIIYSYYWDLRPWGSCCCWEERQSELVEEGEPDEEYLCVGAKETKAYIEKFGPSYLKEKTRNSGLVRVEPEHGEVLPRTTQTVVVRVPDVGDQLGVQRAVLMLILQKIPKESLAPGYDANIVKYDLVESDPIPGVKAKICEVCDLVCAQMEVWWEVVPVQFVLDPPVLPLYYSRRLESIDVSLCAIQMYGREGVHGSWVAPRDIKPPLLRLVPGQPCTVTFKLSLPELPNTYPEDDIITLVAANDEQRSHCHVTRQCATRHPALLPPRTWLGIVPPSELMHTQLELVNDTYQHIYWWCEGYRWCGENPPSLQCTGRLPCDVCCELRCTCNMLRPTRGALYPREQVDINYDVNAPQCDGPVATLVSVRRTGGDAGRAVSDAGNEARASLVMYRVLAPQIVLRLLRCKDHNECGCKLDIGATESKLGTAVLRPCSAMSVRSRMCCRMRLSNITPLPTTVHFDTNHDNSDILKVMFSENDIKVKGHGEAEIRVVLEALKVCNRRLFVYRAHVHKAYQPLYLVVDTAITGLEIACEIPLGGSLKTDSFVIIKKKQREVLHRDEKKLILTTVEEVFLEEDKRKEFVEENICKCKFALKYIPTVRRPRPDGDYTPEIVTEPPSLTRVCPCETCGKPILPFLAEPICLQYINVPLRTVRTRTLKLCNESPVPGHWSVYTRRWPRVPVRSLNADKHASEVQAPGVMVWCERDSGVLPPRGHRHLSVNVYADCWGLYYDQILIHIENVEPIVLDVWIEVVGPPLVMVFTPLHTYQDETPTLWMSSANPDRTLRAKNVSRSTLTVYTYVVQQHDHRSHELPFRLYLRWYDILPAICPCCNPLDENSLEEESIDEESTVEMDTQLELYLGPDYGRQVETNYKVSPEVHKILPGESVDWQVEFDPPEHGDPTPDVNILFRIVLDVDRGPYWYRRSPLAQCVSVRAVERAARLVLTTNCVTVSLCALHLPPNDILRVRKTFHALNIGNGLMKVAAHTNAPWCLIVERKQMYDRDSEHESKLGAVCGGAECCCLSRGLRRAYLVDMQLPPDSSTEVCVEVCVSTAAVWPAVQDGPSVYPERTVSRDELQFYNNDNVLMTIPLFLELEFPVLKVNPSIINFDYVTNGDTRKTYFSVSHTSPTATLPVVLEWEGHDEFEVWPHALSLSPGETRNVYVMYNAVYRRSRAEGCVHIKLCDNDNFGEKYYTEAWGVDSVGISRDRGGGGERGVVRWCRAVVAVCATPSHDYKCHETQHDYTDDPNLLPPGV